MRPNLHRLLGLAILMVSGDVCFAQQVSPDRDLSLLGTPKRVLSDQSLLFTSPFRGEKRDLAWIVPFGALTGLLIASDRHTMDAHIRSNPLAISRSDAVSNASLAALAAIPVGMYGLGRLHYDKHLQEGAVLAGEAFADSLIASEFLKFSFRRASPTQGDGGGGFFQSSWRDSSFPSGHAMLSWSLASAIAHRYPGWLTQTAVYSLATAASLSRITAEKHFPTDVFVGGVLGWLIGREVYKLRHADWDPVVPSLATLTPKPSTRRVSQPSFYAPERETRARRSGPLLVPMDSWIYPVLTRLAALGYIPDQASGLRPWTRGECIRQAGEAEEILAYRTSHRGVGNSDEAARLIRALREEFGRDHDSTSFVELTSVYSRYEAVSGTPLVDGYNFGQTVINDYGRPVGEGSNAIGGFSAEAVAGPVSLYTRDEYQRAPPFASPAGALRAVDNQLEPVLPGANTAVNRFRPVEMYAGVQLGGWALTVGKQDLWWGPGEAGPFSFSNDAEPFYSFRVTSTSPIALPGFLRVLGGFRLDLIGGKLSGHQLHPRPLLNGQKLTWNLTKDFEMGFTRWSLFDGQGVHGFNAASVIRNLFANGATFGNAIDPGDRKSGFDFRWRLPGLEKRVTLYSDFYADDEPNPLTSPRRSAFSPGIYLASLPGLPRWDLRVEAPSTRLGTDQGGTFLYWNSVYQDANTNKGNLLGSWVGRDGRGLFVQATYWHSARSQVQFCYRQNRTGSAFLPGGGTQDDGSVRGLIQLRPDWAMDISAQYERYFIPLLGGQRHDIVAAVQMTYTPRWRPWHN